MRTSNSSIYIKDNKRNLLHFQSIPFFLAPSPRGCNPSFSWRPAFYYQAKFIHVIPLHLQPSLSLQPSSSSTHPIKETATTQVHNYLLSSTSYSFTPYPTNNPSQSSPDPPTKKKTRCRQNPFLTSYPHERFLPLYTSNPSLTPPRVGKLRFHVLGGDS